MAITVLIPTALRSFTDKKSEVPVEAATVREAVSALAVIYPDIRRHLFQDDGELRSFINIFIGETNIKKTGGLDSPVSEGQAVMLVPAIAGGNCTRTHI